MATRNPSRQHDLRFLYGGSQDRASESGRVSRPDSAVTAIESEPTASSILNVSKHSPDNPVDLEDNSVKKEPNIKDESPQPEPTPIPTSVSIAPTKSTMAAAPPAGQSINVNDPTLIALVNKLQDVFTTVGVCSVPLIWVAVVLTSHRFKTL